MAGRVPFLDREFMEYAMTLEPGCKMSGNRMEKYTLRKVEMAIIIINNYNDNCPGV